MEERKNTTLSIAVRRKKTSYSFRLDPAAPDSFANNIKHNMEDSLCLLDGKAELFRCPCQSVANYCFGDAGKSMEKDAGDTIAPGGFKVKCFVEPRSYHGEIHGIIETVDIDGQRIDRESMQEYGDGRKAGRWLIHSTWSDRLGHDNPVAYSAGCIMLSSANLESLNRILRAYEVKPGDIIPGQIEEV